MVAGDDDAFGRHCGAEGRRVLIDDPTRFDGLPVVIDLTPIRDGTGRARSPRPPRPGRRSALLRAADPAHWRQPAHRQAGPQDRVPVRRRGARRGRGDLGIYQRMIAAYRHPDRREGRALMTAVIDSVTRGVPTALSELVTLGRTLTKRAEDVLAFFDLPGTSNGPTEAINGRLEHLRGSALGFRNLTHYVARSLLEAGGFRPRLHPQIG